MIDEKRLLQLLRSPDTKEAAFTTLMREYQQPIYWQIRRMVLAHDDADDILQNTFIKAWQGIDTFRSEASIKTWLFRIAINETLTFLAKAHHETSLEQEATGIAASLASDPYFDGNEVEAAFQQAIGQLPDKQRLVFNLKYFEDMRYEDMSQLLGTSIGALKASYHHAVRKITQYFDNHD